MPFLLTRRVAGVGSQPLLSVVDLIDNPGSIHEGWAEAAIASTPLPTVQRGTQHWSYFGGAVSFEEVTDMYQVCIPTTVDGVLEMNFEVFFKVQYWTSKFEWMNNAENLKPDDLCDFCTKGLMHFRICCVLCVNRKRLSRKKSEYKKVKLRTCSWMGFWLDKRCFSLKTCGMLSCVIDYFNRHAGALNLRATSWTLQGWDWHPNQCTLSEFACLSHMMPSCRNMNLFGINLEKIQHHSSVIIRTLQHSSLSH